MLKNTRAILDLESETMSAFRVNAYRPVLTTETAIIFGLSNPLLVL
jgi:hypothetical protein